jgi:hypothetical protein
MATWGEFAIAEPELAAAGRRLFTQFGQPLGFLATVRGWGALRIHPVCPLVNHDGLFLFVVPSPKRRDLKVDGRYALHAFLPERVAEEFMVAGSARAVSDSGQRATITQLAGWPVREDEELFELTVEHCLHGTYRFEGDWPPAYRRWTDPALAETGSYAVPA